jgi:hypothetical protein
MWIASAPAPLTSMMTKSSPASSRSMFAKRRSKRPKWNSGIAAAIASMRAASAGVAWRAAST